MKVNAILKANTFIQNLQKCQSWYQNPAALTFQTDKLIKVHTIFSKFNKRMICSEKFITVNNFIKGKWIIQVKLWAT